MRVFMPETDGTYGEVPLEDTPEVRAWLEGQAIPKCAQWRNTNLLTVDCAFIDHHGEDPAELECLHALPEPYCPSAYCPRCAGMRELDGVLELIPNAWLYEQPATGVVAADHVPHPHPDRYRADRRLMLIVEDTTP